MEWEIIIGAMIAGILASFITKGMPYLLVLFLPFTKKETYRLEWICLTYEHPMLRISSLANIRNISPSYIPQSKYHYDPIEEEYFIIDYFENLWCVPTDVGKYLNPGEHKRVTSLEIYEIIRLYKHNPLDGKPGALLGFLFIRWRNNRTIKKLYTKIDSKKYEELRTKVQHAEEEAHR